MTALILFAAFSRLNRTRDGSRDGLRDGLRTNRGANPRLTWFAVLPVLSYVWTWFGSSVVNLFWWGQPVVAVAGFVAMGIFAVPAIQVLIASGLISGLISGLNSRRP